MQNAKFMQWLYLSLLMGEKILSYHALRCEQAARLFNHLFFLLSAIFHSVCHLRHTDEFFLQQQTMNSFWPKSPPKGEEEGVVCVQKQKGAEE